MIREKVRAFFWHGFWTDPVIFFAVTLSFLVNLGIWAALFWTIEPIPIILHYNVYFGVDAIGDWRNVFIMPSLSLLLLFINLVLSRYFYYKEKLAAYLFAGLAFILQGLMAVGVASVILINF